VCGILRALFHSPLTRPILYDAYVEAAALDLLADDVLNVDDDDGEQPDVAEPKAIDTPVGKKRGRPVGSLKATPHTETSINDAHCVDQAQRVVNIDPHNIFRRGEICELFRPEGPLFFKNYCTKN
jgi:hypothetical protein